MRRALWPTGSTCSRWLLIVLFAATLLRVVTVVAADTRSGDLASSGIDTVSYISPARALVDDGRFNLRPGSDQPMFFRTPGYPVFIAAVYKVFGRGEVALLIIQGLLNVATAYLAFLIAARLWSETVGVVAAGLVAFDPFQIRAAGWIMTESLVAFTITLTVALAVFVFTTRRRAPLLAGLLGVAISAAALVRPTFFYVPLAIAALLLAQARSIGWRDALARALLFLLPVVILLGGWVVRNHEQVDSWAFSGVQGANMYYFNAAGTVANHDGITLRAARLKLHTRFPELPLSPTGALWEPPAGTKSGPWYDLEQRRGLTVMKEDPVAAVRAAIPWLVHEMTDAGKSGMLLSEYFGLGSGSGVYLLVDAALALFYGAAVHGAWLALRRARVNWNVMLLILGLIGYTLVLSVEPASAARFRVPITPIAGVFAALSIVTLWQRWRAEHPSRRRGVVSGGS